MEGAYSEEKSTPLSNGLNRTKQKLDHSFVGTKVGMSLIVIA